MLRYFYVPTENGVTEKVTPFSVFSGVFATGRRINQREENAFKTSKFGEQVISEFTDMVNGVMTENNR